MKEGVAWRPWGGGGEANKILKKYKLCLVVFTTWSEDISATPCILIGKACSCCLKVDD